MGGNGKGYLDESRWQLERGPSSDSCENSGSTTEEDNNQQSRAKIPSHLSRQTFCLICRRENVLELSLLEPNHKGRIDTTQEWRINMIKFALIQPIFDEGLLRENTMSLSIALLILIILGNVRCRIIFCMCACLLDFCLSPRVECKLRESRDFISFAYQGILKA